MSEHRLNWAGQVVQKAYKNALFAISFTWKTTGEEVILLRRYYLQTQDMLLWLFQILGPIRHIWQNHSILNLHFPLTIHFKVGWNSSIHDLERLRLSSCWDSNKVFPARTSSAPANMYLVLQQKLICLEWYILLIEERTGQLGNIPVQVIPPSTQAGFLTVLVLGIPTPTAIKWDYWGFYCYYYYC